MIASNFVGERRKDPRVSGNIPVKICQDSGDIITETRNISRSGAYCRVNRYIEPMTKMKVCLMLPVTKSGRKTARKVSCEGVVVRVEEASEGKAYNIAIFFSDISPKNAEMISDYVHAQGIE